MIPVKPSWRVLVWALVTDTRDWFFSRPYRPDPPTYSCVFCERPALGESMRCRECARTAPFPPVRHE